MKHNISSAGRTTGRWATVLAATTALTGCGLGGPPPADTQSVIANAVSQEYRQFIEESAGDLGLRQAGADGAAQPLSAAQAAAARPGGGAPFAPAQVEALPADAGG
ncbi:MAG: hypothetical protein AAFU61_11710, partial [Pseudomonadota bacterium]